MSNPGPSIHDANCDGPEMLLDLLEEQAAMYRRLCQLSERQQGLVYQDDTRPLLALLAERQKLVDGLLAMKDRLAPFRERWTELYRGLEEPVRRRVATLLEEANSALGGILQSDRRDTATLSSRREALAQQMAAADAAGRAGAAYAAATSGARSAMTNATA